MSNEAILETQSLLFQISCMSSAEMDMLIDEQIAVTRSNSVTIPVELVPYFDKYSDICLDDPDIEPIIRAVAEDSSLSVDDKVLAAESLGGLSVILQKQSEQDKKVSLCKEQFKRDIEAVIDNYVIGILASAGNPVAILAVTAITYRETDRAEEAYYDCIK